MILIILSDFLYILHKVRYESNLYASILPKPVMTITGLGRPGLEDSPRPNGYC